MWSHAVQAQIVKKYVSFYFLYISDSIQTYKKILIKIWKES